MAVAQYKKYKISLNADSHKTQGLRTGDIVRRQYFDGKNIVYSLMCVLSYGVDKVWVDEPLRDANGKVLVDSDSNVITQRVEKDSPYFIGALLGDSDEPKTGEILDFARVTNLFDTNRSGALYLTASDDQSPFMDVIDGIGRNKSLCWPENVANTEYIDPMAQYVVKGTDNLDFDYIASEGDNNRICHIRRKATITGSFIGLQQDFYQFIEHPNQVLISYKIKSNVNQSVRVSIGYTDDPDTTDGVIENVPVTNEWEYKLHAITIDNSGRHLRSFKMDLGSIGQNDEIWIADFNIILLSSISNFGEASQIRVGKLDGVVDDVFGKLDSYGGYFQKLFATNSVHISGTLTAGDENGFGATFYAGKIHKNAFLNSLQVGFIPDNAPSLDNDIIKPTGIGQVYVANGGFKFVAQGNQWLLQHAKQKYCFSFWAYSKSVCQISVIQNDHLVSTIQIPKTLTHGWHRVKAVFELFAPDNDEEDMIIELVPSFEVDAEDEDDQALLYFSAPQLEAGVQATQYQPTDDTLTYTEDYGAWFNQGGIGGTIQNPLLRFDNDGSIQSRSNSFRINNDGSGHIANGNIRWDEDGKVTFGENVTLNWDNLSDNAKNEMQSKSVKITGADTFTLLGDESGSEPSFTPASITLTLEETNIASTSAQRQWYYLYGTEYVRLPNANGKTLVILPNGSYWGIDNTVTIKCVVTQNQSIYTDTITIRKQFIVGYSIEISSDQGQTFKNGQCRTTLTANVYYQGKLVSPAFVEENFTFLWKKYRLPNLDTEVQDWWLEQTDEDNNVIQEAIDRSAQTITLGYEITGSDLYVCELLNGGAFPYSFPVIF